MISSSLEETTKYVPRCDRSLPEEQQTRILLRPLTFSERSEVANSLVEHRRKGARVLSGTASVLAVRLAVVGWDNLVTPSGAQVEFTTTVKSGKVVASDESLNHITRIIGELYAEIMGANELDEDDEGNSDASPPSSPDRRNRRGTESA